MRFCQPRSLTVLLWDVLMHELALHRYTDLIFCHLIFIWCLVLKIRLNGVRLNGVRFLFLFSIVYILLISPKPTEEDVPYENDLSAIVHDINLDDSDENVKDDKTHGPGIKRLTAVHQGDEDERMVMVSLSSLTFLTDFIPYKVCTRPECDQPLEIRERHIGCGLILRWVRKYNIWN